MPTEASEPVRSEKSLLSAQQMALVVCGFVATLVVGYFVVKRIRKL